MTNDDLAQAVAINSAIEKLSSIVENKGEPMGLSLGMGTPITIEQSSPLYSYFVTGIEEELNRLKELFRNM